MDYATKDEINRFVQYLRSELRKADRPDLQWVLYGERQETPRDLAARKDAIDKTAKELHDRAVKATDKLLRKLGIG